MAKKIQSLMIFLILIGSTSCSVFNAGTMNLKYSDIDAGIEGDNYELKTKIGNVSASIRQMEHPKGFRRWDYLVKLSPSIHVDRFDFQSKAESTKDLKYRRVSALGNFKIELFTPSGQFVFTAGFGGGIYSLDDQAGFKTVKTREVRKFDLSYNAFLSERIFLMMGPRYYKTQFEQYTFVFRIGYFWGDIP